MKALTLLMLFASFLALVTGQDTLELTVGREGNVVVLRCRRSNGGIPGDPEFERTNGTVLQEDSDQTGLAEGELRVTITEHSTVLCKDNDAQSNTLRIPVFPSGPPPDEELFVFRGDTEELNCTILNPPPEDFRDLYTLNGWIQVLQAGVQFLTLQSAPDCIDPETFALTVSVGEDIQDGESYQCQVSIAFSSDSDSLRTYTASGAKITIRIAVPFQVTGDFPATVDSTLGELANFSCSITGSNASAHWRVGNDNFTDCSNSVFCVNSQMISETLQETMLTIDATGVPPDTPLEVECVGVQVLTDFNIARISRSTLFTVRAIRLSVLGRTDNTVVLRCRRQDDELLPNPVFTATVGPELQGPEVLEIGDIIINITEHSAIICNNGTGGRQSNTIYLPAFPTGTPPSSEVHVLQGTIAELPCAIDPVPLDRVEFRNLYSIVQWVHVYQDPQNGIQEQSFTPASLPSGDHLGIADVTFSFFVRIGETIHSGDSYKCEFSIREWSSSIANTEMGNRVTFEGGNISIIAEAVSSVTNPIVSTTITVTTVGVALGILIFSLMIAFGIYLVYKRMKKGKLTNKEQLFKVRFNQEYSLAPLRRDPTYERMYDEHVHIYDEPQLQFHEHAELHVDEQANGSYEQPLQSKLQPERQSPNFESPPERQSPNLELPPEGQSLGDHDAPEYHEESLALQPNSFDQVEDAIEEYPPPDYATAMSYPLVKASRANSECNTVSELVEPEPPEAPQSRSLTLQPALNETQGSITESLVYSGIPEEHPPLDYVNTAFSLSTPVLPDIQLQSPTRQPNYSETERNCIGPLIFQPENTLSTNSLSCFESEQHTPDLHASTTAHHEYVMEEDVHTANEGNRDHLSDRQVETELGATSIAILQSTEQSVLAPTSPDFVCTKPDCPCQRDRCSYHDCLVSEIESQHKTYVDYRQLSNNTDMPDSPNHAQQKLALAKSVRIQKSDSARNQSSQQSNLQIIDKLNPSVPFMDGIDVIECDSHGGHYYNPTCDFVLEIPGGAVPEGTTVQIEVGVTLYGPFQFPDNARPISPIVWLCVRQPQPEGFKFVKPVEVALPHYLDLTDGGEESLELGFLKADHYLNQNGKYQFKEVQDGKATFQPEYGVIHTDHFCYLCLKARSGLHLTSRSLFCLHRIVPKPITTTAWDIIFCVTFSLQLCLESVKRQYHPQLGYKIVSNRFKFKTRRDASESKLKIHFSPCPPGGWQLVLESEGSEITPSEVEFWNKEMEEMEWMHLTKEYPPKLTIEVSGEMAVAKSAVEVTFTGIDDHYLGKLNTTISLLLPQQQGHMNSDELSLAIPRVLSCPGMVMSNTMNQLCGVHPIPFNGAATTQPLALMYNSDGSPLSPHNQAEESQLMLRHSSVSSGFASISSLTASSGFHSLPRDIISTSCYSHPALQEEPELRHLMNEVAAKVPDKWKDMGIQLGLNIGTLNGISVSNPANPKHCLCEVFSEWRKQGSSPYTWSTVVQALEAEAVGEYQLAQDLTSRLIAKYRND